MLTVFPNYCVHYTCTSVFGAGITPGFGRTVASAVERRREGASASNSIDGRSRGKQTLRAPSTPVIDAAAWGLDRAPQNRCARCAAAANMVAPPVGIPPGRWSWSRSCKACSQSCPAHPSGPSPPIPDLLGQGLQGQRSSGLGMQAGRRCSAAGAWHTNMRTVLAAQAGRSASCRKALPLSRGTTALRRPPARPHAHAWGGLHLGWQTRCRSRRGLQSTTPARGLLPAVRQGTDTGAVSQVPLLLDRT